MSIYFGNDTVNDLYIGLTPVSKGYVGTHLFYNGDNTIIDLTYEKYILNTQFSTLYNTEEAPVKSAILKGQTIINLLTSTTFPQTIYENIDFPLKQKIKPSTTYTVIIDVNTTNSYIDDCFLGFVDGHAWQSDSIQYLETSKILLTTTDIDVQRYLRVRGAGTIINSIIVLEGDYTNVDIPYFEDMQSVKMPVLKTTGKNLYHVSADDYVDNAQISTDGALISVNNRTATRNFIPVKPNTTYQFSSNCSSSVLMAVYGYTEAEESTFTRMIINPYLNKQWTFTTNSSENFVRFKYNTPKDTILTFDIQIEEGSVATEYEPYKSTTVTCNEEVELRGIGDIKDELDLLTGKLTRRIDESGNILPQETTESIDISTVDQDGNDTELSTFDDITHVTLSSEELIPEAELEVATKNEEVLNTMSLEMDDISATQTTLEETSNTQSENVDSTMLATTEIYEQLL